MATAPDDASVSSDEDSIVIMTQTHDAFVPQFHKTYAEAAHAQVFPSGPPPSSATADVLTIPLHGNY